MGWSPNRVGPLPGVAWCVVPLSRTESAVKYVPIVAGVLLGLLFLMASVPFLLHLDFAKPPPLPAGSLIARFFEVFVGSGWMTVVKVFELIGGVLVMVPRTRALGLVVLGPILVNIVTCHLLVMGDRMMDGMTIFAVVVALFLVWCERRAFVGLVAKNRG